jgi:putative ABC transport system permease protein
VQIDLQRVLGEEFEVHRWDEILPFIRDLLDNIWLIFGFVTAVFLLVIMLGIVNSMFMNVMERVREIGTMMALGVRQKAILGIFIMEGAFLGAVGAVIGLSAGMIVVYIASLYGIEIPAPGSTIRFMLRPFLSANYLASAFCITTLGSALVSVWPAWRASRLRPVEALGAV